MPNGRAASPNRRMLPSRDCDFLETAAYNAIASEQDASKRMDYIEKFTPAFPKSQFDQQVSQLAMYELAAAESATAARRPMARRRWRPIQTAFPRCSCWRTPTPAILSTAAKAATCANKVIALGRPQSGRQYHEILRRPRAHRAWPCRSQSGETAFCRYRAEDRSRPTATGSARSAGRALLSWLRVRPSRIARPIPSPPWRKQPRSMARTRLRRRRCLAKSQAAGKK